MQIKKMLRVVIYLTFELFVTSDFVMAANEMIASQFFQALRSGDVLSVELSPTGSTNVILRGGDDGRGQTKQVQLMLEPQLYAELELAAKRQGTGVNRLQYSVKSSETQGVWWMMGIQIVALVFVAGLFFFFRSRSGSGGAAEFGKSRARTVQNPKTNFRDVAGCDEAKEELSEIVEFLKNPNRFHEIGARIPHGCLLVGPPGSGKTLLAKAVAGEARVPFFTISGSDFVEMFVGVGAARVRDLFDQAQKVAPCIIFIDEIDAVGRKRSSNLNGGNDEREQTLNQLLVEMDGFETKHDIIILAATNRADVLDPALLRPGRFDRQVIVDAPDVKGREEILRVHARKKPFEETVDLRLIARRTPGFVGADLENLLNEAALLAARGSRRKISVKDLDEAADRVVMGPERKSKVMSDEDKRITAVHEAGHAVIANLLPLSDRVHKLTIVPRGRAAGYMMPMPSEQMHFSKNRLLDRIGVALAGRVAEELEFGDVTTGAQNDFQQATGIAWRMVTEWGMSDAVGVVAHVMDGDGVDSRRYGEGTARVIDDEVKGIIGLQYARVRGLLLTHWVDLVRVVSVLVERESLSGEEFMLVLAGHQLPAIELINEAQPESEKENERPKSPSVLRPSRI